MRKLSDLWSGIVGGGKSAPLDDLTNVTTLPDGYIAAARSLVEPSYFNKAANLSRIDAPDFSGVHPVLIDWHRAFQRELRRRQIPVIAFERWRSPQEQERLHAQGRSRAQAWESPHQYGLALDLAHATRGWSLSAKEWAVLGQIGKEIARRRGLKLTWGGDWSFYDPAHWQLEGWTSYKELIDLQGLQGVKLDAAQWADLDQRAKPKKKGR